MNKRDEIEKINEKIDAIIDYLNAKQAVNEYTGKTRLVKKSVKGLIYEETKHKTEES